MVLFFCATDCQRREWHISLPYCPALLFTWSLARARSGPDFPHSLPAPTYLVYHPLVLAQSRVDSPLDVVRDPRLFLGGRDVFRSAGGDHSRSCES
jgi:hypothetical protein